MAFIPAEDCAIAVVRFTLGSQEFSNGWWFKKDEFSAADQQALATEMDEWAGSGLKGHLADAVSYVKTTVYDMRTETGAIKEANAFAGAGTVAQDVVPINTAMVLTMYCANRGRSARGRLYLAGFSESYYEDAGWTAAAIAAMETYAGDIQTNMALIGWSWVIVSKYHDHAARGTALVQDVTSYNVRNALPGTQRRRVDRP